ncbi:hypothetical protein QN277_027041 [Acacia crassicarpa]|uniref:FLZ-type domain-containing protein n=1 Tax=Acacia crassicarpa TaxID=499986 RepID=A0AAE1JCL0_9FABA|nr:hypothetical protein QN277_027041 [Acacia crassicarpa]
MLGNKPRPMIGKLSELLISGARAAALMDTAGSPRGPLDMSCKMQSSPRGLKSYDLGGVGLGIVVALNKSGEAGREILPKSAICSPGLTRSEPIPVRSLKNPADGFHGGVNEIELGSLEDYTYVTCHLPNKTFTKVYYDGGEAENLRIGYNENIKPNVCNPRRTNPESVCETEPFYPTSDFLSSCHLCRKKLHGKDIYMYRGEKAFCSPECRSSQIMMDERKEQCRSEASRSVEVSSSPYNRDQIFSTGILAL